MYTVGHNDGIFFYDPILKRIALSLAHLSLYLIIICKTFRDVT